MKVLTDEELGIATWEGVEALLHEPEPTSSRPQNAPSLLTEQQEAFLRDRFGIKLENPQTGRSIRSWRTDGE